MNLKNIPKICKKIIAEKAKARKEERKRIISLFKEDSIYTGAVIKFEINRKR